jgi:iron complex outermembrane receptor protein
VKKQESGGQASVNLVGRFVGITIARAQDMQRSKARRLAADRSWFRLSGARALTAPAVFLGAILSTGAPSAQAQGTPAADSAPASDKVNDEVFSDEITVTGYRAAVQSALNLKRDADVMMDAIKAEDIVNFPDANLAESLQRLPGIAVDRDNGEGRTITVRGLGSDFTRVRLNGMETLSTAASSDSGALPNRSRGFDFNVFASDLFSSLQVRKTASASTDEGSLGATIDLTTPHPLDYSSSRFAFSAEDAYYENGTGANPRIAGLASTKWFDDTLGAAVSFAYSGRDSKIDRFRRQPGSPDYTYAAANWAGNESPARAGFAAPAGTVFDSTITNPGAIAALSGSNAAAYSSMYPGAPYNTPGTFADSLVRIPSLINIEEQDLSQDRLGITTSLQWRPFSTTLVNLDGLFSRFHQESDISQIVPIGLNRNNTNAAYNTATAATSAAAKRGLYPLCTPQADAPFRIPVDCGGTEAMTTGVFAGLGTTSFSTNPHNLDTYDYYNNPGSVGYGGAAAVAAANGMYFRDSLIGRPSTQLVDAHVNAAGTADYLVLNNVDMRSATDSSYFTTKFNQASLNVQQQFSDTLQMDVLYGRSSSVNRNEAMLVEFNRMDSQNLFVYDERAHGVMPSLSYGFNVADPSNWSLVKGFSVMRHFERETDNKYSGGHVNFKWKFADPLSAEFGFTRRKYEFTTNEGRRQSAFEAVNPTLQELGVTAQDLGKVSNFGQGLDLPAGTPTKFFAPDVDKFRSVIGFDCDCVNKYGDYRISYLFTPGNQFGVDETDNSVFAQLNWDVDVFGRRLFGNVGARYATTDVTSNGYTVSVAGIGPRPISASNDYSDLLPSLNAAYVITDDIYLRAGAAKVMARPLLSNLAPSITGLTTPAAAGTIGSLTIGNPKLNPFRATNYDLGLEWYFSRGSLLSAAYFIKKVNNFPQTVSSDGIIQDQLTPEAYASFLETQTAAQQAWLTSGGPAGGPGVYSIRQFQDAPGGELKGYELTYQQNLIFLPGLLKNLGVQANFTKLTSDLSYILDPGSTTAPVSPAIIQSGPFLGASPESANFTAYYEGEQWSVRGSLAYRAAYVTTYPLATGACAPGACNTPLVNDFVGSSATKNYDASVSYKFTDNVTFQLEGLNLTNQTDKRWAYQEDPLVTQYASTGRQFFFGVRFQY